MNRARNLKLALSLLLAFLAVGLGGVSVYWKVQSFQPLGFSVEASEGLGAMVTHVTDPKTGLRAGDQILLVQGAEALRPAQLADLLREEPTSKLTVQRGLRLVEVTYHRPPLNVDFPYLVTALIGVVYLLIGLFTSVRQKEGQGFLFYLWCLTSALVYLLTLTPAPDLVFATIYLVDTVAYFLLPALTVHLFLVFPTRLQAQWWRERLIPFVYLPAAALTAIMIDQSLLGGILAGKPTRASIERLDRLALVHLGVFSLAAVGLLAWRLVRERSWEQNSRLKWVAFGVTGGYLPFLAFYVLPYVLDLRSPELLNTFAVAPLAFVPLAFAWAILRYKLWDIEVIVRDTISSTLTLLLGIIGFSLVNLAITRGISAELGAARNVLLFAAGLGIAGLLVPTRAGVSSVLERLHYRETFAKRRALSGLGRELLHERDLSRLGAVLLRQIGEGLEIERTNLYLAQSGALVPLVSERDLPSRLPFDALGEEIWREDVRRLSGIALPAEPLSPSTRLFVAGYRYAFPLVVRGRGIGLVVTGFKGDQTPLSSEDVELIRNLLDQAALAIENAQLVGQLHNQLDELQRLQHYTEGIFESSPAGIAVIDGERRLVSVNAAFAQLTGVDREAAAGRDLMSVLPISPLPAPEEGPVEVSWCDASGQERYLQLSLAVFEPGRREGLHVLVVHDVTERVAMENALREKDRLAALGMLAAGVAHEVNTPITGISSYAQMLLADTPQSDPHYDILKKVERQTFRAARIVNNLLEFARNRQKERRPVDVTPLVSECLDLLGERISKRRIVLDWTPPEG
ncbi:MAG TPA: histidine kinase dimerization/phospho-acceptor domain-containing protein, partial [Thermoanaerobaculia bacterium]|nr:histidine kinase dimerization/phospho-acceptor domain-containing protein [Thermoanaerobaculia bacterium]